MMLHRYWRIVLLAPVLGFLIGLTVFGLIFVTGSPEARPGRLFDDLLRSGLAYGIAGLAVAIAALIGGITVVGCIDRHLAKSSGMRTTLAALGAAGGVLALGVVCATVQWARGDGSWTGLIVGFSVALGIAAGSVAAVLVYRAERHSERPRQQKVGHPLPSAWAEF